jgi:hypothetical protein
VGLLCNRLRNQVKRLEAFFKQKAMNLDDDDGDDKSFGKWWEFIDPSDVEYLNIELDPMTRWTHFVHKFKNAPVALPILYKECVKVVLLEKGGTLYILCETMVDKPYMFTFCVEYNHLHSTFQVSSRAWRTPNRNSLWRKLKNNWTRKCWWTRMDYHLVQRPWPLGLGNYL